MSNFREKAREIRAAGEAERGNFEPSGAPLRIYNYWLDNSNSSKAELIRGGVRRENFCHFWRVVVFWAGLLRLGKALAPVLDSTAFMVITLAAAVVAVGIGLATADLLVPMLIILGVIAAIGAVVTGIVFLHQRYWNSAWDDTAANIAFGFLFVAMVFGALTAIIAAVLEFGFIALLVLGGMLLAATAIIIGAAALSEFLSGRRALARDKAYRERREYYAEHGYFPEDVAEPKQPGGVKKFFSALADFLILATQIVRVKKWKICPMVDVPVEAPNGDFI